MWDELKGLGGLLFFIGCVITWVSFLVPHINPTWIPDPYQFWQWGIFLVGTGIGVFVSAWVLGKISFKRRSTYYHVAKSKRTTRRIAKLIVGGVVLTIVAWGMVTYGPGIWETIQEGGQNSISLFELWNNRDQLLGKEVIVVVESSDILHSEVRLDNLYYWTGDYSIMHENENITQDVDIMLVVMPQEYESWEYWEEPIYLFGKEDQTQYVDKNWNWWLDKLQITGVLTTITFNYWEYHWEFGVPQSHEWYEWKSENLWALNVTNIDVLKREWG